MNRLVFIISIFIFHSGFLKAGQWESVNIDHQGKSLGVIDKTGIFKVIVAVDSRVDENNSTRLFLNALTHNSAMNAFCSPQSLFQYEMSLKEGAVSNME